MGEEGLLGRGLRVLLGEKICSSLTGLLGGAALGLAGMIQAGHMDAHSLVTGALAGMASAIMAAGGRGWGETQPRKGVSFREGAPLMLVLLLFPLMFCGCAGDHLRTTGKTLLAVQATADTAFTSADALCDAGTLTTEQCTQIKQLSEQVQAAYATAADAYLAVAAASDSDSTTAQAKYAAAKADLDTLVTDLTTTLTKFGVSTTATE